MYINFLKPKGGWTVSIIKAVEIIESNTDYTVIKVCAQDDVQIKRIYVSSAEVLERSEQSLTLKVKQNDSLLIDRRITLWWDQNKAAFIRQ